MVEHDCVQNRFRSVLDLYILFYSRPRPWCSYQKEKKKKQKKKTKTKKKTTRNVKKNVVVCIIPIYFYTSFTVITE